MRTPLPLRITPVARETVPSFLARLAAVNGLSTRDFAVDMGFTLRRAVELETDTLGILAVRGGLDEKAMRELTSWTGSSVGEVRMSFRGEVFVSRALRNPEVRGCPVCLRQDAEGHPGRPTHAMAMRGDWQLREVSVCIRHAHPLVLLWTEGRPTDRHDMANQLQSIESAILAGKLEKKQIEPSAYDYWLDDRLATGKDDTWLATQSLYAATTFCRLLGAELLRSKASHHVDAFREAQAEGFSVARQGEGAIREALKYLSGQARGAKDEPRKAFGDIYVKLSQLYLKEEAFSIFRDFLRDEILANWPVASGETVLGKVQSERHLHSLASASKETGLGSQLLQSLLREAGALDEDKARPAHRRTFVAAQYAGLLNEIPTWVGPADMRAELGATVTEFQTLKDEGILVPRTKVPKVKNPWRKQDATQFLADLQAHAIELNSQDKAWETLQLARTRSGHSLRDILAAIGERLITLGRCDNGYHQLMVLKSEIDGFGKRVDPVEHLGLIPAAAYARTVGFRGQNGFISFIEAGHTPARRMAHPRNGLTWYYLSEEDIFAFRSRFVTTSMLAEETGRHRNTIRTDLKKAGLCHFAPEGVDFGAVYLRSDVARLFKK